MMKLKLLPLGLITLIGFSCAKNDGAGNNPTPMPTAQTIPQPPPSVPRPPKSCFKIGGGHHQRILTEYIIHDTCPVNFVVIPSDLGIEVIGKGAFNREHRSGARISKVYIPDTVTRIEDNAFAHNNLKEVWLPYSVVHIGKKAFYGNTLAPYLRIPSSVKHIGAFAFTSANPDRPALEVCIEHLPATTTYSSSSLSERVATRAFDTYSQVTIQYKNKCVLPIST